MIPKSAELLREDFIFETLPSKTFRIRDDGSIRGVVDGCEALKQAIYLILNTERYVWLIFSWNYGFEKTTLIGKDIDYVIPEIERRVRDALLQDDRITAIQDFTFTVNKNKVTAVFTVVTVFGSLHAEQEVEF